MHLSLYQFDFNEIRKRIKKWTWQEVSYGYKQGLINKKDVVEFAKESLVEDMPDLPDFEMVLELAIKNPEECIEGDLQVLCNIEVIEDERSIKNKWLYAILNYLFEKSVQIDNLQEAIDRIYADFDYPEEIADLVSYMPYNEKRGADVKKRLEAYLSQGVDDYNQL